jgi:succinate dehydrogenase / fumarate reductase, cytochrome b subunit
MATSVSPSSNLPSEADRRKSDQGVAPLRAGEGHEFLLRRLHSLSGIVPVGAFLLEHILYSNAIATQGPAAYAKQVRFLGSLPFVTVLEAFGIWLPILFHAVYGFWIWYRGRSNLISYPWAGNWMYAMQRWTGAIAFAYIIWHTYTLRFTGIDLHMYPGASFGKVQHELAVMGYLVFYLVGLISAAWHFSYGVWLFMAKWGVVIGENARRKTLVACMALFVLISGVGIASIYSFKYRYPAQPYDKDSARQIETMQPEETAK